MSFGENLKNLRTHQNITQQQLADYLNVTRPTIAGYETKGKEPDYQTLVDIADYFQVPVDFLIRETNIPDGKHDLPLKISEQAGISPKQEGFISSIVEQACKLDSYDLLRLQNYLQLLLNQPAYKKKAKNKSSQ